MPKPYYECKAKESCTFLSKDLGWEVYQEIGDGQPHPPIVQDTNSSTIYLTMSSFRDRLCPITLFNLYTKAAHPDRVHVGIVQQNAADDADCLDTYCDMMFKETNSAHCAHKRNIRITRIDASEARGPTWARAKGSQLMEDEEFCMQTDSHMDFVPEWDVHMIEMWLQTGNEYGILSTYVADSSTLAENLPGRRGTNGLFEVPHLCMVTFSGGYGMVRNWGTKCMRNMPKPKLTNMVWGAGLSFSKCHAERKAPYDPHTPHIFDGEEFSRALRFWTWGYDIYTPHRVYVVHNYGDSQSDPKHSGWGATKISREQRNLEVQGSVTRLSLLMEMPPESALRSGKGMQGEWAGYDPAAVLAVQQSRYGLGDRRSLSQAIAFSGIDTRQRQMTANRCGNLAYVPFVQHPWGAEYIPRYNATSEAFIDVRDPGSIYYDPSSGAAMAAWEKADALRRKGLSHLAHDPAAAVPLRLSGVRVQRVGLPPALNGGGVDQAAVGSHRQGDGKHTDILAQAMEHKAAVNLVCVLLIVLIICARLCVAKWHRISKTANKMLGGGVHDSAATVKEV